MTAAGDRRPIAARGLRVNVALANWLVRRRASPDAISLAGMACALLAGWALAVAPGHWWLWLAGAVLVQARLMANLLDGMVAIGRGVASATGELFNEIPDRVSDTAVLAGLGIAADAPWLGLAAALAAMATAYVRAVGRGLGQASDFCGPMAKQQRMAVVTAAAVWCAATPPALAAPAPAVALALILALALVTAGRRLFRLAMSLQR